MWGHKERTRAAGASGFYREGFVIREPRRLSWIKAKIRTRGRWRIDLGGRLRSPGRLRYLPEPKYQG